MEQGPGDASRRTRLANERTYLAWWRSGLTALAVAIGTGRLVPALTEEESWTWPLLGAAYGVLGIGLVVYAEVRRRAVERALDRGDFMGLGPRAGMVLAVAGTLLGAVTLALILLDASD